MSIYKDLLKHSAVYAFGNILARIATVLLLPLYTKHLPPSDYGIIALIEVTSTILEHIAGGGLASAVTRFSSDPEHRDRRHDLWFTGLVLSGAIAAPVVLLSWLGRAAIARVVFGPDVPLASAYIDLTLWTLCLNLAVNYCCGYLRVLKRSGLYVALSLLSLALRVTLNVWTIAFLQLGVRGFLYSGLIAGGVQAAILIGLLFLGKPVRFLAGFVRPFWSFGWPLIIASLASLVMHQADRYLFLWLTDDMSSLGLYSFAFNVAQALNSFIVLSFLPIWMPSLLEINALPNRQRIFQNVFESFVFFSFSAFWLLALLAEPIVRLVAHESYASAAAPLPLLSLAFFLYPLHSFLSIPAVVHKQTRSVAWTSLWSAVAKVASGTVLIQLAGIHGAAISCIVTYLVYSLYGHWRYRQIEDLRFNVLWIPYCAACGWLTYQGMRWLQPQAFTYTSAFAAGAVAWAVLVVLLALGPGRTLTRRGWRLLRSCVVGTAKRDAAAVPSAAERRVLQGMED